MNYEFSDALLLARKSRGLLQSEAAKVIHVASDTYSRWEQGKQTPSVDRLETIINAFPELESWRGKIGFMPAPPKPKKMTSTEQDKFSGALKSARLNRGLTHDQIYRKLGIPVTTYSKYERAISVPDMRRLRVLIREFPELEVWQDRVAQVKHGRKPGSKSGLYEYKSKPYGACPGASIEHCLNCTLKQCIYETKRPKEDDHLTKPKIASLPSRKEIKTSLDTVAEVEAVVIANGAKQLEQTPIDEDSRLGDLKRYMDRQKADREAYLKRCRSQTR